MEDYKNCPEEGLETDTLKTQYREMVRPERLKRLPVTEALRVHRQRRCPVSGRVADPNQLDTQVPALAVPLIERWWEGFDMEIALNLKPSDLVNETRIADSLQLALLMHFRRSVGETLVSTSEAGVLQRALNDQYNHELLSEESIAACPRGHTVHRYMLGFLHDAAAIPASWVELNSGLVCPAGALSKGAVDDLDARFESSHVRGVPLMLARNSRQAQNALLCTTAVGSRRLKYGGAMRNILSPNRFRVVGQENIALGVSGVERMRQDYAERIEGQREYGYCPATIARGKKKNVAAEFVDWVFDKVLREGILGFARKLLKK